MQPVAHHCCAVNEAEDPGPIHDLMNEFRTTGQFLSDALTCCDMTTTPKGEPIEVERRLTEILSRYGDGHLITRSIKRSSPHIVGSVRAIERVRFAAS
jgi:hypothetical protein